MAFFTPSYDLPPRVHLLKNPSLTVQPPIPSPSSSVHPLPPDISAYFVYPFSLEAYVLQSGSDGTSAGFTSSQQVIEEQCRHAAYLEQREEAKRERERERIRRIAPGWQQGGGGGALQPTKRGSGIMVPQQQQKQAGAEQQSSKRAEESAGPFDGMTDLGEHLDHLDSTGGVGGAGPPKASGEGKEQLRPASS